MQLSVEAMHQFRHPRDWNVVHLLTFGVLGWILALAVMAALLLTIPPGEPASEPSVSVDRPTERPLKILFAGDSISRGFAATAPDKSFVELTHERLAANGPIRAIVAGQPGQATAEATPAVLAAGTGFDVVVVELGTNDYGKSDPLTFRSDYGELLAGIRQRSPEAVVVCLGAWGRPNAVKNVDHAIQEVCGSGGGIYRPLHDIYAVLSSRWVLGLTSDLEQTDSLHPSDIGHGAIAAVLEAAIKVV